MGSNTTVRKAAVYCRFHDRVVETMAGERFCAVGRTEIAEGRATGPVCELWWTGVTLEYQQRWVEVTDEH